MTAFVDWLAQRSFGVLLQLAEDECGDLGRRERFVAELDTDHRLAVFGDVERKKLQLFCDIRHAVTHQPLDGVDRAVGVIDQFLARRVAHDDPAVRDRGKRRWGQACRHPRQRSLRAR